MTGVESATEVAVDVVPQTVSEDETRAAPRVRSTVDGIRAGVGAVLVVVGVLLANVFDSTLLGLAADTAANMDHLPAWVRDLAGSVAASIVTVITLAVAVWALVRTRYRRFALYLTGIAVAAVVSIAIGRFVYELVDEPVQRAFAVDVPLFRVTGVDGRLNPADPLLAAATAVLTLAASFLPAHIVRRIAALVAAYAVASVLTIAAPPLNVVTDVGVGLLVGSLLLWIFGRRDLALRAPEIRAALATAGYAITRLQRCPEAGDNRWLATDTERAQMIVIARSRDDRSSALVTRAVRWMRLRKTGDHRPFLTLRRAVEHEAMVCLQARNRNIPTPAVRAVTVAGVDGMVLARDVVGTAECDELPGAPPYSDREVRSIWRVAADLQRVRIAHGSLRLDSVVFDDQRRPWLINFERGELAAGDQRLGTDLAELLASTAAVIGTGEAVRVAHDEIGSALLQRAIPWLQPLALSATTRRAIGSEDDLAALRTAVGDVCGLQPEAPVRLERIEPKTVFVLGTVVLSAWFLLPQLSDVDSLWSQARDASLTWALVAVLFSFGTYVAATGSLLGAIPVRLAFAPALAAQVASSFANRVTPAKVGGIATNLRYFQRKGVPGVVGATAVGLNAVAGVVMHVVLTLCALLLASGNTQARGLQVPGTGVILLVLAALVLTVLTGIAVPSTRRLIVARVVPQLRAGGTALLVVVRDPVRLLLLFGGSAIITLCYLGAMYASLRAFGSTAPIPIVALLFLTGSAVANAAPTPGGLGAAEAALIAALSTVEEAAIVVPAVFLYRLVTFWLPILPGWVALTALRRGDHL